METRILLGAVGALVHICKKFESIKLKSLWLDEDWHTERVGPEDVLIQPATEQELLWCRNTY